MNGISAWAIRRPVLPLVLFLAAMVMGVVAFLRLPINANPAVDIPTITVTVPLPGGSPSDIEVQVARRVESAVLAINGVRHVTTAVTPGLSTTTVDFRIGTPSDRALTDARDAVSRLRPLLPGTIGEPVVTRVDAEGAAIATYAVALPGASPQDLSWFVDDTLSRSLRTIPGVAAVSRIGGLDREIRVELDPHRLAANRISALDLNDALRGLQGDFPAGRAEVGDGGVQSLRALGAARSVEALAATLVPLPNGRVTRLSELGEVRDGAGEPANVALRDGEPVVAFQVQRAKGSSEVTVAAAVAERLRVLAVERAGLEFSLVQTSVTETLESYHGALEEVLVGAALAVVVVFAFLRDWRATLVAGVALPLSVVPTFAAMQLMGFTLNGVSLLALTLSIGILVDDAIVEVENIVRHAAVTGEPPREAAIAAADRIGLAVVATTLAIVAVFVPVSAMSGIAGQYFREFGLTVCAAVLISLAVARLVTPILAAVFLKPPTAAHKGGGRLIAAYERVLGFIVRRPWTAVIAAAAVMAGTVVGAAFLETSFLPDEEGDRAGFSLELPPGASAADASAAARLVTTRLLHHPAVREVFVEFGGATEGGVGGSGAAGGALSRGSVTAVLVPRRERSVTLREFRRQAAPLISDVPDLRWGTTLRGNRMVSVTLVGEDGEVLAGAAAAVELAMVGLPGFRNVRSTTPSPAPELRIEPLRERAAALGVPVDRLARTLLVSTLGDSDANRPRLDIDGRRVPIRVTLSEAAKRDPATLELTDVAAAVPSGSVPLVAVADLRAGTGEARIDRYDGARRIAVEADVDGLSFGAALARVSELPAMQSLPEGVRRQDQGDAELMGELFGSFGLAMGTGILLVYVVLVVLFRDFLQPMTILVALPLSVGGAIGAMLLTGRALDLSAAIGFLMLMGIVAKNSILLVEFAIEAMREGRSRDEAIIAAGLERAQPIIMTTAAMVAGMLLPAFGIGAGAAFRSTMAVVVIGGLIASTVLSLLIVPGVFVLVDRLEGWLGPRLRRLTTLPANTASVSINEKVRTCSIVQRN
ncbi:efflux RND transporter permease subunit [Belnapia sp. T18]|uniref:Efflux RND transporter permease subunit n=1 Tax=Belnapia arida TaxID=2804533 RepID=A0ABS1UCA2_9PROT|nr:efflux RND transporter permease subunit [Belnapia arida]MBL6082303.1 efflux RND transporter permease subunit [Belnapia arida]